MTCPAILILTTLYGWPLPAAQAIDAYLYRESRCLGHPPTQRSLCGGPCYGGFQWSSERWRKATAWMTTRGLDPWRIESQVHYAVHEWKVRWPQAAARLKCAGERKTAFGIWNRFFGNGGSDK